MLSSAYCTLGDSTLNCSTNMAAAWGLITKPEAGSKPRMRTGGGKATRREFGRASRPLNQSGKSLGGALLSLLAPSSSGQLFTAEVGKTNEAPGSAGQHQ
jgi:hypothetical protein